MKKYFLFGGNAVTYINEHGWPKFIKALKGGVFEDLFATFVWTETSTPTELLSAYDGWQNWMEITLEQYKQIQHGKQKQN